MVSSDPWDQDPQNDQGDHAPHQEQETGPQQDHTQTAIDDLARFIDQRVQQAVQSMIPQVVGQTLAQMESQGKIPPMGNHSNPRTVDGGFRLLDDPFAADAPPQGQSQGQSQGQGGTLFAPAQSPTPTSPLAFVGMALLQLVQNPEGTIGAVVQLVNTIAAAKRSASLSADPIGIMRRMAAEYPEIVAMHTPSPWGPGYQEMMKQSYMMGLNTKVAGQGMASDFSKKASGGGPETWPSPPSESSSGRVSAPMQSKANQLYQEILTGAYRREPDR